MKRIQNNTFSLLTALAAGILFFGTSCTKNFADVNTNKNAIATVTPAVIPFLFSHAQDIATVNQANYQIAQNLFADQYCQYFACEATYFGSDRLVINQSWVGANFNPYYTDVLPQLQTIFANTDSTTAEHAMAEVVWVLAFMKATDYWGPIPYFQAGSVEASVPYDAQDKIYADFFSRLDAAGRHQRLRVLRPVLRRRCHPLDQIRQQPSPPPGPPRVKSRPGHRSKRSRSLRSRRSDDRQPR
jgi:hypothetical protein